MIKARALVPDRGWSNCELVVTGHHRTGSSNTLRIRAIFPDGSHMALQLKGARAYVLADSIVDEFERAGEARS